MSNSIIEHNRDVQDFEMVETERDRTVRMLVDYYEENSFVLKQQETQRGIFDRPKEEFTLDTLDDYDIVFGTWTTILKARFRKFLRKIKNHESK